MKRQNGCWKDIISLKNDAKLHSYELQFYPTNTKQSGVQSDSVFISFCFFSFWDLFQCLLSERRVLYHNCGISMGSPPRIALSCAKTPGSDILIAKSTSSVGFFPSAMQVIKSANILLSAPPCPPPATSPAVVTGISIGLPYESGTL